MTLLTLFTNAPTGADPTPPDPPPVATTPGTGGGGEFITARSFPANRQKGRT